MRRPVALLPFCLALLLPALAAPPALAQDVPPVPTRGPLRDGVAFGGVFAPALEGSGPWLMPSIRLSVPLGARHGIDVDSGAIVGGVNKYSEIRSFLAFQIRFLKEPLDAQGRTRYWLIGPMYMPDVQVDRERRVVSRKGHTALTIGHGWAQRFRSGARVTGEIGFSGGDGFLVFAGLGVQIGAR